MTTLSARTRQVKPNRARRRPQKPFGVDVFPDDDRSRRYNEDMAVSDAVGQGRATRLPSDPARWAAFGAAMLAAVLDPPRPFEPDPADRAAYCQALDAEEAEAIDRQLDELYAEHEAYARMMGGGPDEMMAIGACG